MPAAEMTDQDYDAQIGGYVDKWRGMLPLQSWMDAGTTFFPYRGPCFPVGNRDMTWLVRLMREASLGFLELIVGYDKRHAVKPSLTVRCNCNVRSSYQLEPTESC